MRGADDGPDRGEPALADVVLSPPVDELRDVLPERTAVGEREVLEVRAARIRGLDDGQHAEPVVREERLERVVAEVRVHGDRVGERRERGRIGAGGRRHVASLSVGDHEQACLARVAADLGERGPAVRALRLEERRLRLDDDRHLRDGVDDAAAELHDSEACRHERGIGIEADAERRALALHRCCEPIREVTRPLTPSGYEPPGRTSKKRPPEGGLSILGGDLDCL